MSKLKNRRIEQYYFESFRKCYSLPEGVIEYGDKPDVIIRGARNIGIEITNFFLEEGSRLESEQVQRIARQETVSKARRMYLASPPKRFELAFGFNAGVPIRNQKDLAKKMADLATLIQSCETGEVSRDLFPDIPELSFVYLNASEHDDPQWRIFQGHNVTIMELDSLQKIVTSKEAKEYRPCDAYWLLVVVDFLDTAQDQEIRVDGIDTVKSSVFGKVIVYKTVFQHTVETSW